MLTTIGTMVAGVPERYKVERSVPLSDTQRGVVGPWVRPQALTRLGSVTGAIPGTSDTRLTWVYRLVLAEPGSLSWANAGEDVARARTDATATVASGRAVNMRPPRFRTCVLARVLGHPHGSTGGHILWFNRARLPEYVLGAMPVAVPGVRRTPGTATGIAPRTYSGSRARLNQRM